MEFKEIKKIMGQDFIGPEKLKKISFQLKISDPFENSIPKIPFSLGYLKKININKDYILILGISESLDGEKLTINKLRSNFGWDPNKSEPCFYNQDWYLNEPFANNQTLDFKWYLIRKNIIESSRGQIPENIHKDLKNKESFPPAILTAFTFFSYYLLNNGQILWEHDFIWCSDKDKNNDRIYTGRYIDPQKINKNGFNIHRHLTIKSSYGLAPQIL